MILIPLIILLVGGGGAAAYFMYFSKSQPNPISPAYTITPKEVSETPSNPESANPDSSIPVQSGFSDTENAPFPNTDTSTVEQTPAIPVQ